MTGSWFVRPGRSSVRRRWSFGDGWSWQISYPVSELAASADEYNAAERLRESNGCVLVQGITSLQCCDAVYWVTDRMGVLLQQLSTPECRTPECRHGASRGRPHEMHGAPCR